MMIWLLLLFVAAVAGLVGAAALAGLVALALVHVHNLISGNKTGSDHSGVEQSLRKSKPTL